jgi:hypothetical protein
MEKYLRIDVVVLISVLGKNSGQEKVLPFFLFKHPRKKARSEYKIRNFVLFFG